MSRHLSTNADPQKYQDYLDLFNEVAPGCPWNSDAAETLAKPPSLRGWQQSYVDGLQRYIEEQHGTPTNSQGTESHR